MMENGKTRSPFSYSAPHLDSKSTPVLQHESHFATPLDNKSTPVLQHEDDKNDNNEHKRSLSYTIPSETPFISIQSHKYEYLNLIQTNRLNFLKRDRQLWSHSWIGVINEPLLNTQEKKGNEIPAKSRLFSVFTSLRSLGKSNSDIRRSINEVFAKGSISSLNLTVNSSGLFKHLSIPSIEYSHEVKGSFHNDEEIFSNNEIVSANNIEYDQEILEIVSGQVQNESSRDFSSQRKSESPCTIWLLLSIAVNFLFIGPLVVAYWYSTWSLIETLVFSDSCQISVWITTVFGLSVLAGATFLQDLLFSFSSARSWVLRHILMRVYTYVLSIGCISQWRGIWNIYICYIDVSLLNSALSFSITFVLLLLMRCFRTVPAPPVYVDLEILHENHYKIATFYGRPPARSLHFLYDTLFTVVVVQPLCITCWRGLWEILDLQLYPDDVQMSAILTLGISFALSSVLLSLNVPIKEITVLLSRKNLLSMLLFDDAITVLYSVVCITHWRGIWMLLYLYLPGGSAGLYVTHGVSFVILAMGLTANSLLVRGVQRDGSFCRNCGVVFDMKYVTYLQQAWKNRKDVSSLMTDKPRIKSVRKHSRDNMPLNINA